MLRIFWDTAVELDKSAKALDEGLRFPLCREGQLERLVRETGLQDVESMVIEIETVFQDFDDYWRPFLGHVGPAPGYVMSLDVKERNRLRDKLQVSLPIAADGSISLKARAWAVKGQP